jgi:hypothetical protein
MSNDTKKIYKYLSNLNLMNVPISKIITPIGMNFNVWHTNKKKSYISDDEHENYRFIDNPIFFTYMKYNNKENLTPDSLVPLGVMIFLYNDYNNKFKIPKKRNKNTDPKDETKDIFNHDISLELIKKLKIEEKDISPSLKIPFSILLGRDVFSYYLRNN